MLKDKGADVVVIRYECGHCKAKFFTTNKTPLKECVICHREKLHSYEEDTSLSVPMIPFFVSLEHAKKTYRKKVFFRPLVPLIFKKKETINSISKLYLPIYFVQANVSGEVAFLGADKEKINQVGEKFIETKKYNVLYDINVDYQDLSLNTSSIISEKAFQTVCQYSSHDVRDATSDLIAEGYVLEKNIDPAESAEKGRKRVMNHSLLMLKENIIHAYFKLDQNNASVNFSNSKEIWVPIYYMNVRYHDKDYMYLMNGNNGIFTIDLTFSKWKIVLWSAIVFILMMLLAFLVAYYL